MTTETAGERRRILSPVDRFSEIVFGLIMVLTFTGTLSVTEAGRKDVQAMLTGAIGCNVAWGIVDAVMYILSSLAERRHDRRLFLSLRRSGTPEAVRKAIEEKTGPSIAGALSGEDLEKIHKHILELPEPPAPGVRKEDVLAAVGVFLLVLLATFPVVLPFVFIQDPLPALRVSNAVAIILLFFSGYALGKYAGHRPVLLGFWMVVLGSALVGLTIALGG